MILRGQKINLRTLKDSDKESIFRHINNKKVSKYTDILYPYKISEIKKFIEKSKKEFRKRKSFYFGIEILDKKGIIGVVSLTSLDWKNKKAEIEFWLSQDYWQKGIAKESLYLTIEYAFKKLRLNRIFAKTLPENTNSINLLKRIRFIHEGILRKSLFERGKFNDIFVFSILKNEFVDKK